MDFIVTAHSLLDTKAFSVEGLQKAVETAAMAEDDIDDNAVDMLMEILEIMSSKGNQHEEKSREDADD